MDDVIEVLDEGWNVLYYNLEVREIYNEFSELESHHRMVYVGIPKPLKPVLIQIGIQIGGDQELSKMTISEITEKIIEEGEPVWVFFEDFEELTSRIARILYRLYKHGQIQYVASANGPVSNKLREFLGTFKILGEKREEINITYPVFFILTIIAFIIYVRISFILGVSSAYTILGGFWLSFLIFRTLIYIGR